MKFLIKLETEGNVTVHTFECSALHEAVAYAEKAKVQFRAERVVSVTPLSSSSG